jgi:hypothetical protein
VAVEAVHGIGAGAVGPQVLQAAEPLLEVAVELGVDLALGLPGRDGRHPQADHERRAHQGRDAECQPGPGVDGRRHRHHAGHQDDVADEVHGDAGEEHGHGLDVAVDPLDELAGAVAAVPGLLQAQHMGGQPLPQGVADPPRHPGRRPHHRQVEQVGGEGGGDVGAGEPGQRLGARTAERLVGEQAEQHRQGQPQPHGHDQDRDDACEGWDLGSERGGEQARRPLRGGGVGSGHSQTTLRSGPRGPRASFRRPPGRPLQWTRLGLRWVVLLHPAR